MQSQLSDADRREVRKSRKLLAADRNLNADEACSMFTTMAEVGGAPDGANRVVNLLPAGSASAHPGVSAQACVGGTFTSVVSVAAGLDPSEKLARDAQGALERVQSRLGRGVWSFSAADR